LSYNHDPTKMLDNMYSKREKDEEMMMMEAKRMKGRDQTSWRRLSHLSPIQSVDWRKSIKDTIYKSSIYTLLCFVSRQSVRMWGKLQSKGRHGISRNEERSRLKNRAASAEIWRHCLSELWVKDKDWEKGNSESKSLNSLRGVLFTLFCHSSSNLQFKYIY